VVNGKHDGKKSLCTVYVERLPTGHVISCMHQAKFSTKNRFAVERRKSKLL